MRTGVASRTAEYMALFRALESGRPADRRLFEDRFAAGFLSSPMRSVVALSRLPLLGGSIRRFIDRRWPGPRVSATVRTRVIDEALSAGLSDGARQLVLLGAGYDSRPYRIEGADQIRTFEVDHPDTQAAKRRRLLRMLPAPPTGTAFVGIDFDREDLGAALGRAGYSSDELTFFIWEGVTNYLTADAVDATFRWISTHAALGSRIVFTYVHSGLLDGSERFSESEQWVGAVRSAGEPFTFGLDPDQLAAYLAERGLRLLSDVSTTEALDRYRSRLGDAPLPPAFYRVALAQVGR
jgi:methyltransferase (TIGR00027 family)